MPKPVVTAVADSCDGAASVGVLVGRFAFVACGISVTVVSGVLVSGGVGVLVGRRVLVGAAVSVGVADGVFVGRLVFAAKSRRKSAPPGVRGMLKLQLAISTSQASATNQTGETWNEQDKQLFELVEFSNTSLLNGIIFMTN
jgi:hypothetical protein